jgi:putative ABC transport system substrate-binding protein
MRRLAMICFLASAGLAAAAPALAQTSDKVWRLGVLSPGSLERFRETILPELAKQGLVEGGNLVIEIRGSAPDKLPELARELLATQPDAVVAVGSFAIRAIQQASSTIPIIGSFIGEDPVAAGFATSLARPGGNVTGIEMLAPQPDAVLASVARIGAITRDVLRCAAATGATPLSVADGIVRARIIRRA